MPLKRIHDTCPCPLTKPCLPFRPGVTCAPIKDEERVLCNFPQKPDFAIDHKEPVIVEWPPKQEIGQGDCQPDTGIREDLLAKIPDQIVPQVITVRGTPAPAPGQDVSPIQVPILNHPVCPDGQLHVQLDPPQPVKTVIKVPEMGPAVRQPQRPWRQCIENTLVNDQVRRPLARWCHKRPLPPLVIPKTELKRMQDKCTEPERKAKEKAERIAWRECQRLKSRERMAKWNYTVESLLERKKAMEEAKEKAEKEGFAELTKSIKAGRDAYSEEQTNRAKKLMLYRKGLIKDFHSALAFSKMMQDIERMQKKGDKGKDEEAGLPICETKCMKTMLREIERPELDQLAAAERKPKKINQKLLKTLQSIEKRKKEQEEEMNNEICSMKQVLKENLPDLPEVYLKKMAEPECREVSKEEKFLERRNKFYEEIDEKLAVDAFIEAHEKEVERQACEYQKYRLHKDLIRKQTEKRIIDEKVAKNIANGEKAAAAINAMMAAKKKENAHDYDALKEKWEEENKKKEEEKKAQAEKLARLVEKDYLERKGVERCKWQMRDVSRLWARERLVAVENYEQECERKYTRRAKAEEVSLFNQAMASEKKCLAERQKMHDNAYAEKIKDQYFEEMQEMKDYANHCIRDWVGKGRSPIPMHMAMKKWEYDSQMDPRLFREYEAKKRARDGDQGVGEDGYAVLITNQFQPFQCKESAPGPGETTQDTARRLGFC